ncbi:MAG: MG2 domain-containing protein, partial [Saprospiraceae bacterium]
MFNSKLTIATFFLAFLFIVACKKSDPTAEKIPDSVNAYVYAYTSGTIAKTADIKVHFTRDVVSQEQIGEIAERVISFSPGILGEASWEDRRTLKFTPNEQLNSGEMYVATVILNRIITDVPRDAQSFQFSFRTREQSARLAINGILPASNSDLTKQEITGKIVTADAAEEEQIEAGFTAKQNGQTLTTEWQHVASKNEHRFTIKNVIRNNSPSEVAIAWNGKALDIDKNLDRVVEVPALGDFKILDIDTKTGDEQRITLTFSDPLQKDQDLKGLIKLSGFNGRLRFTIDGNQVIIYPNRQLTNTQKVFAYTGIKNVMGNKMANNSEWNAVFTSTKPKVKLVGNGVILPDSEGLIFPFEAVSLNAVEVEIFKIFNNNILQFLQTNDLDGQYDLQRVGRIILQQKVDLATLDADANFNKMTRYALDLSRLMETDPNAIYQVRIGFRPEYAEYPCDGDDDETITELTDSFDEEGDIVSIMDSYYGINGHYEGYEYEHRDNPCFPAFFNNRRFVQRNVIASNLGIIAKQGKNKEMFVAVSDLRTTDIMGGAVIEFYDYQQQLIKSVNTDSDGTVKTLLDRDPFVVVAKRGTDSGYLKVTDGNSLALSRFDVAGASPQKGLKGFVYGERGVWRPGDSIYLNFILDDVSSRLPQNHPITFEFYDPRGQIQEKRVTSEQVENIYPIAVATSADAPTGNWRANIKVGKEKKKKTIKVETVKPNRLKINLDFGQ